MTEIVKVVCTDTWGNSNDMTKIGGVYDAKPDSVSDDWIQVRVMDGLLGEQWILTRTAYFRRLDSYNVRVTSAQDVFIGEVLWSTLYGNTSIVATAKDSNYANADHLTIRPHGGHGSVTFTPSLLEQFLLFRSVEPPMMIFPRGGKAEIISVY